MTRDKKKTLTNGNVRKQRAIVPRKTLKVLREFNSECLTSAISAARLMIQPYLSDSGLEIQIRERKVYLSPDSPPEVKHAATFLGIVQLSDPILKGENIEEITEVAFFIGLSAIPVLHTCGVGKPLSESIATFIKDQEARRRGGKAKAKWTPEVEQTARRTFNDIKRGQKISDEAAIRRTMAKLQQEGYAIGRTTLRENLVKRNSKG